MKTLELVNLAIEGDGDALESLVLSIREKIYNLSLKMLFQPSDAEDAAQEILIKIVTRLESFKQESSFETWAYAVASRHLLNKRKSLSKYQQTFSNCEEMIIKEASNPSTLDSFEAEQQLLVEEMRISCMQGLLQCLDWDHRIAYILGESMEFSSEQGGQILDISPAAFRQRLSRSRKRLRDFLTRNCEYFQEENPCRCAEQAKLGIEKGWMDPQNLQFSDISADVTDKRRLKERILGLDVLSRDTYLMSYQMRQEEPGVFIEKIKSMLGSDKFDVLKV